MGTVSFLCAVTGSLLRQGLCVVLLLSSLGWPRFSRSELSHFCLLTSSSWSQPWYRVLVALSKLLLGVGSTGEAERVWRLRCKPRIGAAKAGPAAAVGRDVPAVPCTLPHPRAVQDERWQLHSIGAGQQGKSQVLAWWQAPNGTGGSPVLSPAAAGGEAGMPTRAFPHLDCVENCWARGCGEREEGQSLRFRSTGSPRG